MSRRHSPFKLKLKKQTIYTIFSLLFFVSGIIVLLSFSKEGILLNKIYSIVTSYLGWCALFLAPLLLLLSLLFTKVKWKIARANTFIGASIFWLSAVGLAKSGSVGLSIWGSLEELITGAGSIILLTAGLMVGLVVFFNTPITDFIDFVTNAASATANFIGKYIINGIFIKKKTVFIQEKLPLRVKGEVKEITPEKPLTPPVSPPKVSLNNQTFQRNTELGTEIISNVSSQPIIWEYPSLTLLNEISGGKADRGDVKQNANIIEKTLESFGIIAHVSEVNLGPAVTQYALEIALGTKLSKITSLQNDLALALAAPTGQIRIEAPIPGRNLVGIEIPNRSLEVVPLKRILSSDVFQNAKSKLTVALGLDVSGSPTVTDLAKMPHVLIAGATGSGKSICINAFILSLLYHCSPSELKLILVDPKRVELSLYNGIPHLLTPVIVDLEKILSALKWTLAEMDRRYKSFASVGVRNLEGYNELAGFQALPYIVIIVDELADVMMFAPVEVEDAICRIAQMARATGIHLVLSTQRPSVDVITGLIKANIPCRLAFNVTSMIDSRVIIDAPGAEKLLGRGDMLYIPPDQSKPTRIQGAYVSEQEANKVTEFLKSKGVPTEYTDEVTSMPIGIKKLGGRDQNEGDGKDNLFEEAVHVVCQYDRASASLLQRRLSIGYARAARIIDQLEEAGIIGPGEGAKPRDVLVRNAEEYLSGGNQTPVGQNPLPSGNVE